MITLEELLSELNKLRKDYADDPDGPTHQALHHTFLFVSYQAGLLKDYLREAAEREAAQTE